jgi:hypothetical protein
MIRVLAFVCTILALAATLGVAGATPMDSPLADVTVTATPTAPLTSTPTVTTIYTATPTSTSTALPDLALTLTGTASTLGSGGQSVIYFMSITNVGGATSGATSLTLPLPAGTANYSTISSCAFDGATYSCPVTPLAAQQTLSFWAIVTPTGTLSTISATATLDPNNLLTEASKANNVASSSNTLSLTTTTPTATATPTGGVLPDLTASLSGAVNSYSTTQPIITFTLVVQNLGYGTSGATTVSMPLPYGTTMYSAGTCSFDGYTISCPVSALSYYQTTAFTISLTSTSGLTVISASATVDPSYAVAESNESNNTITTSVTVSAAASVTCYYNPTTCPYGTCQYGGTSCASNNNTCIYYPSTCGTGVTPNYGSNPNYGAPPVAPTGQQTIGSNPPPSGAPPASSSTTSSSANPAASSAPAAANPAPSAPAASVAQPSTNPAPPSSVSAGFPWLQISQATQAYSPTMSPLWTAQPGELYFVEKVQDGWALAVWEGDNPTDWSVWIQLDAKVQQVSLSRPMPTGSSAAPTTVAGTTTPKGEQWLVVFAATQTYDNNNQPKWMAQPGEWYRVSAQDSGWVLGVYEKDPPDSLVWIPLSDSVTLTFVPTSGTA